MDALNFLYEKPTVTWLDYYLNPAQLQEKFDNLNAEPSIESLVLQLCDQARLEEIFLAKDVLPADEREYHKNKCTKLWVLVLKICAYLKWNIVQMRKCISVVNLKRIIEELCSLTWNTSSLAYVLTSTENLAEISRGLRFVAIFCARCVLDYIVYNSFPQPPAKITVSNPSAQVDPSHVLAEAKTYCLATLDCVRDLAVEMLERALQLSDIDYCPFLPTCFEIPVEGHGDIMLNWDAADLPSTSASNQINYDLGVYYFYAKKYEKAAEKFKACINLLESTSASPYSHWTFDREDLKGYLEALSFEVPSCSTVIQETITESLFSDALSADLSVIDSHRRKNKAKFLSENSRLPELEGTFALLRSFDPSTLRNMIFNDHVRIPVHYSVPLNVQSCLSRLPKGSVQDLISIYVCKASQLTPFANSSPTAFALLQSAMHEFRASYSEVPIDFRNEDLRLNLCRWHNWVHRCSDVQKMGHFTQDLAAKVKNFMAEHVRPNSPSPNPDISLLAVTFLLNTCDWEYIIFTITKHYKSRSADFAKFLAALCYHVSRGIEQTDKVAQEFLEVVLPITIDPPPKNLLMNRQQFLSMLGLIKEQMAIGILLSFFGELYNYKQGGLVEIFIDSSNLWPGKYAEINSVNRAFLKDVLHLVLHNGLLVNPNNPFLLRSLADLRFCHEDYNVAAKYYLQCLASCSDFFTKPFPENVVDDKMINNMIKCCAKLDYHTIEAMLSQLCTKPNYHAALKAMQEPITYDGAEALFPLIWDINLLENFISSSDSWDKGLQARIDEATRLIGLQEINAHNPPDILHAVKFKRQSDFLSTLCTLFF